MTYQDKWTNGKQRTVGTRECEARYEIIREFCLRTYGLNKTFTVLDVGSNWNYFELRLTESFPQCYVMAFEYVRFDLRVQHLRSNNANRVLLLNKKIRIEDLEILGKCCRFDVVLLMSVFHHLGGMFDAWLDAFKNLGSNVIIEFAASDNRSKRTPINYRVPDNADLLGYGSSHIKKDVQRPIVLIKGNK